MEVTSGWPDIPLWVIFLTCALVLISIDYLWTYSYFDKRGIPGPRPWPLFGSFVHILRVGTCRADLQWKKQFGNFYGFYRGRTPILVVHDEKMLESIMVKDFSSFTDRPVGPAINEPMDKGVFFLNGQEWKDVRNLMVPTFTSGKLKQMFDLINGCGISLGENFLDCAKKETPTAVKELFGGFTMDVIASTAFGLDVDSQKDPDNVFIKHVKSIFKPRWSLTFIVGIFFPAVLQPFKKLVGGMWPTESIKFFEDSIKMTVERRRKEDKEVRRVDFLQLLMNAEANDTPIHGDTRMATGTSELNDTRRLTKKRLTTDELVAQAFLFFIAGYETTATNLQCLSYNLALNPECQERVYREIEDIIGDDDPTYESVSRLTYLEQCISESLRLHSPIGSMSRVATADTKLGDYPIPKGSVILLPFEGIHHNPDYFPNPEVFDPDRFSPEAKAARRSILFAAFGNGPRICIGLRLALLESKVAMVHVLRKVRFLRCDETEVPLTFLPRPTLVTRKPIMLRVELR